MGKRPNTARMESTANASGNSNIPLDSIQNKKNMSCPTGLPAKNKAVKNMKVMVRRSGRIRNLASPVPNQEIVVEEIDIVDIDRQEEPQIEELNSEPISSQQNLEEKIDFLVESVQEFKSQATKVPFSSESQLTKLNYKSLYIDSQKKIEALTEENHQLAKKLEFALGKAEAFEQMKDVFGNVKDMVFLSNLGKATEALIKLSSQAITGLPNSRIVTAPDAAAAPDATAPDAVDEPRASSMKKRNMVDRGKHKK